jgi:hypothetical protein
MAVVAARVLTNSESKVRQAALAADTAAVLATPVDTGRARANWVASIGGVPAGRSVLPPSSDPLRQAQQVLARWREQQGAIFLSNGVPYIGELERGSSRQAPNGMTTLALQAAARVLRVPGLLKGV